MIIINYNNSNLSFKIKIYLITMNIIYFKFVGKNNQSKMLKIILILKYSNNNNQLTN